MSNCRYVIAIDPSVDNCGCAVFEKGKLIDYDIIKSEKKTDHYLDKARYICSVIYKICEKTSSKKFPWIDLQLVTEIPQHFGNAGYLARESGAVLKLSFVAGMIFNITPNSVAYEPNEWKGQWPKCVIRARLERSGKYGNVKLYRKGKIDCPDCKRNHREHDLNHNIVDAIGIGHKHIYGGV